MRRAAIVTGAGSMLGTAIAVALSRAGIDCVLTGRGIERLQAAQILCTSDSAETLLVSADVTTAAGRDEVVTQCLERFGRIDVLVNNAGLSKSEAILDFSEETWRSVMATNLDAPFFLSQLVMSHMRDRGWGRIVNITSVYAALASNNAIYKDSLPATSAGDRGPFRIPAYHASKGGLLSLTRDLAVAVAPWGITVNALSPGMFPREGTVGADDQSRRVEEMTPLGRRGEPQEIGSAVRFLASEEAAFITGVDLVVDGGWSIW